MYSTHNEEKSVIAGRFIRPLKKFIDDFSVKNVYIEKLDNIVSICSNTYHNTYHTDKMRPVDAKPNTYIDFHVKIMMIKILNLRLVIR